MVSLPKSPFLLKTLYLQSRGALCAELPSSSFDEVPARIIFGYIHRYGVFAEDLDHIVKRRPARPCETLRR
jgi:hypothetical protein